MNAQLRILLVLPVAVMAAGCSDGIRQSIRQHDFKAQRDQRTANISPPSPIANVADMPGWTTDLDGALAFARDNGRRTVLFVQSSGAPQNRGMKQTLSSTQMNTTLANVEKVTIDAASSPDVAARFGVQGPAVLVLDPNGTALSQQAGSVNKGALSAALR